MSHYQILSEEENNTWKAMNDNPTYEPSREEKLAAFKTDKAIKEQLKVIN